jgi:hypothetical protein
MKGRLPRFLFKIENYPDNEVGNLQLRSIYPSLAKLITKHWQGCCPIGVIQKLMDDRIKMMRRETITDGKSHLVDTT